MNILDVLLKNVKMNKLFLFNDELLNKILNVIYIKDSESRNNVIISDSDVTMINLMINYLSQYNGSDLTNDFYNSFSNCNDKSIEFYIYFIYLYMRWTCDKNIFTDLFLRNINCLFYLNDIECKFNPEKFKLHYSKPFLGEIDVNEEISLELVNYIKDNLPDNLDNDLEKAIAIYVLLSKVLVYSPVYTIHEELSETNPFSSVTPYNNEVVCVQFSIIYNKLLTMFGIASNLAGDINSHMFVNLNFGNMMIRADATQYGVYDDKFNLSDMTNLKYGFRIEGFKIFPQYYAVNSYPSFLQDKLDRIIDKVYNKMNLVLDRKEKINDYICKIQKSEFGIGKKINKEDIDRRVVELNKFPMIINGTVEDTQFYNMLVLGMFFDIAEERVENISFYKMDDGKVILNKMLVVYDEQQKPYYYFFRDGKLVNFSVDEIVDIILNEGWLFKYQTDIDALYLDEEKTLQLIR